MSELQAHNPLSRFDYSFADLPLIRTECGYEAGHVDGCATIHFTKEEWWFEGDGNIHILCSPTGIIQGEHKLEKATASVSQIVRLELLSRFHKDDIDEAIDTMLASDEPEYEQPEAVA